MAKPFLKKKSKKLTTKTRCKIEKKVREHNRKIRKEMKKKSKKGNRKKEITVPGKAPFKEQLLIEAQARKQEKIDAKKDRKDQNKKLREALKEQGKNKGRNEKKLESLIAEAQEKQKFFEAKSNLKVADGEKERKSKADGSMKAYYAEVRKVIEAADVVIEVVDARDPLGNRCPEVETAVLAAQKRLVVLLNKIDLVPKENVEAWLKFLRKELPTVAFKASTQQQHNKLGFAGHDPSGTSKCVGADILMKVLGNYCRNKDIKTRISVGIVGFPNVGKSSVINSLKRGKCCNVGAVPGITRSMQEVELDKKIRLLDSPGVVMMTKVGAVDPIEAALRNAVRIESLEDPITPVEGILRRCTKENLMLHYNIPEFGDALEFLTLIAERMGRIKKGGVPDQTAAARKVLLDWNSGKIRYYTQPPQDNTASSAHLNFEIVSELSKEFSLDDLDDAQGLIIDSLPTVSKACSSCIPSTGMTSVDLQGDEVQCEKNDRQVLMETAEPQPTVSEATKTKEQKIPVDVEMTLRGNQQSNKRSRRALKRRIKKKRRSEKIAVSLSEKMEVAFASLKDTENYSFTENFGGS